jgi:hypothetical protein
MILSLALCVAQQTSITTACLASGTSSSRASNSLQFKASFLGGLFDQEVYLPSAHSPKQRTREVRCGRLKTGAFGLKVPPTLSPASTRSSSELMGAMHRRRKP